MLTMDSEYVSRLSVRITSINLLVRVMVLERDSVLRLFTVTGSMCIEMGSK